MTDQVRFCLLHDHLSFASRCPLLSSLSISLHHQAHVSNFGSSIDSSLNRYRRRDRPRHRFRRPLVLQRTNTRHDLPQDSNVSHPYSSIFSRTATATNETHGRASSSSIDSDDEISLSADWGPFRPDLSHRHIPSPRDPPRQQKAVQCPLYLCRSQRRLYQRNIDTRSALASSSSSSAAAAAVSSSWSKIRSTRTRMRGWKWSGLGVSLFRSSALLDDSCALVPRLRRPDSCHGGCAVQDDDLHCSRILLETPLMMKSKMSSVMSRPLTL